MLSRQDTKQGHGPRHPGLRPARQKPGTIDGDALARRRFRPRPQPFSGVGAHCFEEVLAGATAAVSMLTRDWSISRIKRCRISDCSSGSRNATASAASSVQPPAKTANRRNNICSAGLSRSWLQSIVARNVLWLHQRRSMAAGQQTETIVKPRGDLLDGHGGARAAASSMASGMPSSQLQIATTDAALLRVSENSIST